MNSVRITAQVSAQEGAGEMLKLNVILPDGNTSVTVPTDAEGKVIATFPLPPGHYTVVASIEEDAVYQAATTSAEFDVAPSTKEPRTITISAEQVN